MSDYVPPGPYNGHVMWGSEYFGDTVGEFLGSNASVIGGAAEVGIGLTVTIGTAGTLSEIGVPLTAAGIALAAATAGGFAGGVAAGYGNGYLAGHTGWRLGRDAAIGGVVGAMEGAVGAGIASGIAGAAAESLYAEAGNAFAGPLEELTNESIGSALRGDVTEQTIIDTLRGTTDRANAIADAIDAGRIDVNLLDDSSFASRYLKLGGDPSKLARLQAFNFQDAMYLRQGAEDIFGSAVHEGTHALNYINSTEGATLFGAIVKCRG